MYPLTDSLLDTVVAWQKDLRERLATLPFAPLSIEEARNLGGHLHEHGPELVDHVAMALHLRPQLYQDIPHRADDLLSGQKRADAFYNLARLFSGLADLAMDCHRRIQAEVTCKAKEVITQVKHKAQHPDLSPQIQHRRRLELLLPALMLLDEVYESRKSGRKPDPKKTPPKTPPKTPKKDRSRAKTLATPIEGRLRAALSEFLTKPLSLG